MDVFIADDSALVRERLANMLADIDGIRVVGEAGDIRASIDGISTLRPQAIILDVELPGGTGFDVLKAIAGLRPKPRVIMLTNNPQSAYREQCRRAGAEFFFDKTLEFEKVAQVLRVLRGVTPGLMHANVRRDNDRWVEAGATMFASTAREQPRRRAADNGALSPIADATLIARQLCEAGHSYVRATCTDLPWLENLFPPHDAESLLFAALCAQVMREGKLLVVADIHQDPRSNGSLLACGNGPMRFFAGIPLVMKDGRAVGVLSVLHPVPLTLSDVQKDALVALARQMVDSLELTRYQFEREEGAPSPLSRAATRDPLTGLQNRAALHESMMRSIAHANRYAEKMAFLYVDIDNLRKVNETCGRAAGDSLLVEAGKRLQAAVRDADTVARLGGDEFAVLAQGLRGAEDAVLVAQKLHRALSLPYDTQGLRFTPSCSIGVSIFPNDGVDGDSLLRHADTAMYRAKSGGRGGYELFASSVR